MTAAADNLKVQADGIRKVRDDIQRILKRGHGKAGYNIAESGAVESDAEVETARQDEGEPLEAFLVRVWTKYKVGPGKSIEFSAHDGRVTARITTRASDDRIAQLSAQIAQLSAQLGALSGYLLERQAGAAPT